MEVSPETLDKIADRFIQLNALVLALQDVVLEKKLVTPEQYSQLVERHYKLQSADPAELRWRDALRGRPGGGKR
jgi:hypothetical protein